MSQLCFKTVLTIFLVHGSSVRRPLALASLWLLNTASETYDLTFRAFPLRDIAPSRRSAGSSACPALLLPITCTSPSSRQHIRGVTLGLRFLRNPSPYALRLAPTPGSSHTREHVRGSFVPDPSLAMNVG